MFDPTLSKWLKRFPLLALLGTMLLYPFHAALESRPISNMAALILLLFICLTAITISLIIIQKKSGLTWQQVGRLSRLRLDAAMRGEHWQEDMRFRDIVLDEQREVTLLIPPLNRPLSVVEHQQYVDTYLRYKPRTAHFRQARQGDNSEA